MNEFAGQATALAPVEDPSVRTAEFPVSAHAITTWCAAIGEENPLYLPDRGGDQIAPMSMLQTWAAPRTVAGKRRQPTVHARVRGLARKHGFDSVVATNYDLIQYADLRVGDLVTERCWVDRVSEPKSTGLGDGQFVTIGFSMVNQEGQQVGSVRARTFYYSASATEVPLRPQPGADVLDEAESVEVTRTLVIAAALASNDHEPVHHDHAVARQQGLRDIIVSIVTTAGLVGAYGHRRWGMKDPRFLQLRLAAPSFPGDVLTFSGESDPGAIVAQAVRVQAIHARGVHSMAVVAPQPTGPANLSET
jgi:acyl dehydratase